MRKHEIIAVAPDSIAEELSIQPGDKLLHIDGDEVEDFFDYRYKTNAAYLEAGIETADGESYIAEIEKDEDEDLGLEFDGIMSSKRGCCNNCIFCFVDQLPKDVRQSLLFKDDDWRLSFLSGNYITLTNVGDNELDRIISQHISPLYISVHTMDMQLRSHMLRTDRAARLEQQLKRLCEGGIEFHCQIVLVRGVNDGEHLRQTIQRLYAMRPYAKDCAIVPVGLTAHRDGLYPLRAFDRESAGEVVDMVAQEQSLDSSSHCVGCGRTQFAPTTATQEPPVGANCVRPRFIATDTPATSRNCLVAHEPFAYCADEFYVLSGKPLPTYEHYGSFGQLEDGIGMLRHFEHGFEAYVQHLDATREMRKRYSATIATGEAAYAFMQSVAKRAAAALGIDIDVVCVPNRFFGGHVSVSGLLTGSDYYNTLSRHATGDVLLICRSSLNSGGEMFLDDMTLQQLQQRLGKRIVCMPNDGAEFVKILQDMQI